MRIRTEGEYAYREDAIEAASRFYQSNKTAAIVAACEDVPKIASAIEEVLEREDLTTRQKREIAETLSTRAVSFELAEEITVDVE